MPKETRRTTRVVAAPSDKPKPRATAAEARATAAAEASAASRSTKAQPTTPVATTKKSKPAAKAPATRKTTTKEAGALDKFLEGQRAALLEERATYTKQAETLLAEAELLANEREPGDVQFDEESGEGDTLAVERERDLALSAQARAAVDDIDKALAKIDTGRYGICEICNEPIPKERLRALPYADLCVKCKTGGLGRR